MQRMLLHLQLHSRCKQLKLHEKPKEAVPANLICIKTDPAHVIKQAGTACLTATLVCI